MSRIWQQGLAIATLVFVGLITGCSKSNDQVIAEVGSYDITVAEFDELTQNFPTNFNSAQEEFDSKSSLVDSMVVQRLLIQAAYDKGVDKSEEVGQAVAANKDKFLLDVLYKRHIEDKVSISDAELRDFYNKLEYRYRVSHILVPSKDTADMLVTKLAGGASFDQLAYDHSIDPQAKRSRGDLGFIQYGSMPNVPEFEEAIFALDVNEVSPPVKSRYGYHVIKVTDRQPNEGRAEFEKVKENLDRQLKNIKRTKLTIAYVESIKNKYPFTVDRSTLDYLIHKREELYPPDLLRTLPTNDFDDAQLDRNERELVVATWEGGQVTVGEYLTLARALPAAVRPSLNAYDSIPAAVFQAKITDILTLEANKEGLENDDEFKRKLTLFRDLTMADVMRNDSIMVAKAPAEEQLRQYYDAHQDEYQDPARVHIYEIYVSDELVANKLTSIRSLEEFKKRASELTERPGVRQAAGDLGYIIRDRFPDIFDIAYRTRIGEIGGPVQTMNGKYSVFYVIDRIDAQVKDFLAVKQMITSKLMSDEEIERFAQWVKERREATKIEINNEAIWETINKEKYASADTTANTTGLPSGN